MGKIELVTGTLIITKDIVIQRKVESVEGKQSREESKRGAWFVQIYQSRVL